MSLEYLHGAAIQRMDQTKNAVPTKVTYQMHNYLFIYLA